ncbi:hypothetical protein DLJ53_21790 [Acuticoccus sediminis]|uniref:Uncharacterized protein n=1 Tax=Acuticoccus sediminis TaxID=2184697 RepID=A0A8B2NQ90_9HYPH|nr:hypothetical protein [Acuticoccus sediminis]RAH99181.1 hypothetical protein DLJ53_21790 [Acuticoccus sediminis]
MMAAIAWLVVRPRLVFAGAVVLVAVVILGGTYFAGRDEGARSVTDAIERQDARAEAEADGARRDVRQCADRGGVWDVATGTCE